MSQTADQVREQKADSRFWVFASVDELSEALRAYTDRMDGTLVQRYREACVDAGEPLPTPEQIEEYEQARRRQRSTIDIAMEQMEGVYRTWHRVIELYYRQGLSTESRGWLVLMARLGLRARTCPPLVRCVLDRGEEFEDNRLDLPKCRQATGNCCHWDYDTWQVQLTLATKTLLLAINVRSEWTPT